MINDNYTSRRVFLVVNHILCWILAILCLLPIIHILSVSFSGKDAIISGRVTLFPVDFTLQNYAYVAKDTAFYRAFGVSVLRTVLGLIICLTMTILAAYPISKSRENFHGRTFFTWFFMIAVLFSGGLIPTYMVVNNTGLIDTIWALLLPGAVPLWYIILMQNFMKQIPKALSESASIDGASHFRTLVSIILPLCKVSLATISLFIVVDHWNSWYDGMLYINNNAKFPLQTYLRTVIVEVSLEQFSDLNSLAKLVASAGSDSAKIFLSMLPILIVYPFAQRFFVKGLTIGSVKE